MPFNESCETALGRGIQIIDKIAENGTLRFNDARIMLGNLSPTTLSRLFKILTDMGVIYKNDTNCYALCSKVKVWGDSVQEIKNVIKPYMEKLNIELQATVILLERSGQKFICTDKITDAYSPALQPEKVITELPSIHNIGGVFFCTDEEIADDNFWYKELKGNQCYHNLEKIKDTFKEARKTKVWYDQSLWRDDITRFAAPVEIAGQTVAVIGVGVSSTRCRDNKFVNNVVKKLSEVYIEISDQMTNRILKNRE